jgi:AcrR family transcriptional regulator
MPQKSKAPLAAAAGSPVNSPKRRRGVRGLKKDKTRRALLETADRLFQRKGYEGTTLEEICEGAQISLRTFFRYFESKRDLALYENMRNISRLRETLAAAKSPAEALDELEALYDFMAMEFEHDEHARQRLILMSKEPSLASRSLALDLDTEARVAAALGGAAQTSKALDAELLAVMIVGGIRHVVSSWVLEQGRMPLRKRVAAVFSAARRSGFVHTRNSASP